MKSERLHPALGLLWVAVFLLCLPGCIEEFYPKAKVYSPSRAPVPPTNPPAVQGSEKSLLSEAQRLQSQALHKEALARYNEFLAKYPNSSHADLALISVGQVNEILGDRNQAIAAYRKIWDNYPQSTFAREAGFRLGSLYLDEGKNEEAARVISLVLSQSVKKDEIARLNILMGRAQLAMGDRFRALEPLVGAYRETKDRTDKDDARRGVQKVLQAMTPEELRQVQNQYGRDFPGDYASLVSAYRLNELGRTEEARTQITAFLRDYPNHENLREAEDLAMAIETQGPPPKLQPVDTFGVMAAGAAPPPAIDGTQSGPPVLPMTEGPGLKVAAFLPISEGQGVEFGKMVLTGLRLALKTYRPRTPNLKVDLLELDTRGDPNTAAGLAQQAGTDPNILAAVGPLTSKAASAAAPVAEQTGLPMIAISQQAGLPETGPHIFRLFLTPETQARAVARYVVQVLGIRRIAILHPNDAYGQSMRDYFQNEATALGGTIATVVGYDLDTKDFSGKIQELTGVGKAHRKVGAGRKIQVDFEAVFIPDGYQSVAMIAPQFAYHDIITVRLLGTSLWHTPNLLETAARYTQRSIIPTVFFPDESKPEVKEFIQAYRQETGNPEGVPGRFEAYGYDAGRLLLMLIDRYNVRNRQDLLRVLANMPAFPGVTGRFSFDYRGEYSSEPILITVEGREFKPIQ